MIIKRFNISQIDTTSMFDLIRMMKNILRESRHADEIKIERLSSIRGMILRFLPFDGYICP